MSMAAIGSCYVGLTSVGAMSQNIGTGGQAVEASVVEVKWGVGACSKAYLTIG